VLWRRGQDRIGQDGQTGQDEQTGQHMRRKGTIGRERSWTLREGKGIVHFRVWECMSLFVFFKSRSVVHVLWLRVLLSTALHVFLSEGHMRETGQL